jgi:hypothetical protein
MIIDLIPYLELAVRAAPSPPLPPPMTRKSVSFEMGAMVNLEVEKCLDRVSSLDALDKELTGRRRKTEKACMESWAP